MIMSVSNQIEDSKGRILSLSIERIYEVLGIEAYRYRILSDQESQPHGNDPVENLLSRNMERKKRSSEHRLSADA